MIELLDVLAFLGIALLLSKLLGGIFEKFSIPSVLAELTLGVIIGNVFHSHAELIHHPLVEHLSELGVILLLFHVGLQTNLHEISKVGMDATLTATIGIIMPMILSFLVIPFLFPHYPFNHTLFTAAALTATSVGITARVLTDAGKLQSMAGQIILGAAVIDDILGIMVLTVVAGIVSMGSVSIGSLGILGVKVGAFIVAIAIIRWFLVSPLLKTINKFEISGTLTIFLYSLCMALAWVAKKIGLEGIIGAFSMGLILDEVHFKGFKKNVTVDEMIKPIIDLISPIFFIYMGMQVDLSALLNPAAFGLSAVLIACAILGKFFCYFGVLKKSKQAGADAILVGLGMIPRGEVGLIFAAVGQKLKILTSIDYSAIVAMVVVTTVLAPPLLALRSKRR